MERETGVEPATSSLGSWHSTTELLPLAFKSAIWLIPNHLHETAKVSKVSEIHQIYPVWSENGHQNGHQAQPGNPRRRPCVWCPSWCPFLAGKRVQPHYTIEHVERLSPLEVRIARQGFPPRQPAQQRRPGTRAEQSGWQ